MDPFTAIGLASAVVQFVDFGAKLLSGAREIYFSSTGSTEENGTMELIATEMEILSSKLEYSGPSAQSKEEKTICNLAKKCKDISNKILDLIQKTKPKNKKSRFDVFIAAMKDKVYEGEKLNLQKRLDGCRSQLVLHMGALHSSDMKDELKKLFLSAESNAAELDLLQKKMVQLQAGINVPAISADIRRLIQDLLDAPKHVVTQQRILSCLAFDSMHSRFDNVNKAHIQTFQWIFDEQLVEERLQDKSPASLSKISFVDWLENGDGNFHISGKLGSGKSTLMKFLYEHGRTTQLLTKWAGEKKLVLGQFFFWRAGSESQKSLNGLRRSLLHDTLEQCPNLIPSVLPKEWERMISIDWRVPTTLSLTQIDITRAFDRLIQNRHLHKGHRFCFFIDGLDEYEPTCQEDYRDMAEQLLSWTSTPSTDVKLCVSSREYEVFRQTFDEKKRLRLQDLTRKDIEAFVQDRLEGVKVYSDNTRSVVDSGSLVEEVIDRASGVFLWVALVVKSLREASYSDNRLSSLIEKVRSIPKEMEPLFLYLLNSIDPSDRRAAYRTLAVMLKLSENDFSNMTLLRYTFLEDYENDADFALDAAFKDDISVEAEISHRMEIGARRLNGQLKGLLEVQADSSLSPACPSGVAFAHRSIYDFVQKKATREEMEDHCGDFDVVESISHSFLAELKLCGKRANKLSYLTFEVWAILYLRKLSKLDVAPFRFLDAFHASSLQIQRRSQKETRKPYYLVDPGLPPVPSVRDKSRWAVSVIYMAASLGHENYFSWILSKDPTLFSDKVNFATLCGATICGLGRKNGFVGLQFLLTLLRDGFFLAPHVKILKYDVLSEERMTIWSTTLFKAIVHLPHCLPPSKRSFGELLEILLKSGANPNPRVTSKFNDSRIRVFICGCNYHVYPGQESGFKETHNFIANKGEVSLYDLIDYWQLENGERLKELIDQKLAPKPETWYSETSDLEIEDLFTAESGEESNHNPEDQHGGTEPQAVTEEIETPNSPLVEVSELPSKENEESQTSTDSAPNNQRRRLISALTNPITTFALGMFFAFILAYLWSLFSNSAVST